MRQLVAICCMPAACRRRFSASIPARAGGVAAPCGAVVASEPHREPALPDLVDSATDVRDGVGAQAVKPRDGLDVGRTAGECRAQSLESHVVDLADKADIVAAEVAALRVEKEIGRRHLVGPAVGAPAFAAEPFLVDGHAADQKLLHGARVHLDKPVGVDIVAQQGVERRGVTRLRRVAGHTDRKPPAVAVDAEHIAHEPAYEIVFQRNVALASDIVLLAHTHPSVVDRVVPLVAVGEALATLATAAELAQSLITVESAAQQPQVALVAGRHLPRRSINIEFPHSFFCRKITTSPSAPPFIPPLF